MSPTELLLKFCHIATFTHRRKEHAGNRLFGKLLLLGKQIFLINQKRGRFTQTPATFQTKRFDMRLVKVTTVTYVPAYTPEDYQGWGNRLRSTELEGNARQPEVPTPATIEDCVALEQSLLDDPTSDLSLGLYTETEVVNPRVVLELMPEGFTVPDEFERKTYNGIYLDQMERQPA